MVNFLSLPEQFVHKGQNEAVGCAFNGPAMLRERKRELVKPRQTFGIVRDSRGRECRAVLALCSYGVAVWVGIETYGDHVALHLL